MTMTTDPQHTNPEYDRVYAHYRAQGAPPEEAAKLATDYVNANPPAARAKKNDTAKTVAIVVAMLLVVVFGIGIAAAMGEDAPDKPAAKPKKVTAASASPTPTSDPEGYLNQVVPSWPSETEADMLSLGTSTCEAFDRGVTPQQIYDISAKEMPGQTPEQIQTFIRAAGEKLCPKYAAVVAGFKPALPPPPPPKPATPTIEDGTWTVGQDNIPPGTYRTAGIAGAECYWAIYKSGTNTSDIIENHIGGGRLTVTLRLGQDFATERCGTWTKVK